LLSQASDLAGHRDLFTTDHRQPFASKTGHDLRKYADPGEKSHLTCENNKGNDAHSSKPSGQSS
jgi:hypothetical protein